MQKYLLNIENPCQKAQWASMTETDIGKFCSQCSKNVVDFATLTDVEVIRFIESTSGTICSRLTPGQMNRLLAVKQKKNSFQLGKIITSLLILGATESSFAAGQHLEQTEFVVVPNDKKSEPDVSGANKIIERDSLKKIISGKVVEGGRVVKLTEVFIKGTDVFTKTDTLGNFKFEIPNDFASDTIVLVVKHNGFEGDTETIVYKKDLPVTNLIIKKREVMIGETVITIKRKWWQFWKKKYYRPK